MRIHYTIHLTLFNVHSSLYIHYIQYTYSAAIRSYIQNMFCIYKTITEPYRTITEPSVCITDGSVYTEPLQNHWMAVLHLHSSLDIHCALYITFTIMTPPWLFQRLPNTFYTTFYLCRNLVSLVGVVIPARPACRRWVVQLTDILGWFRRILDFRAQLGSGSNGLGISKLSLDQARN